jgi:hypothetical protein
MALKKRYPDRTIKADITRFSDNTDKFYFSLNDYFGITIPVATLREIKKIYPGFILNNKWNHFSFILRYVRGYSLIARIRAKVVTKYRRKMENYINCIPFNNYNGNVFCLEKDKNYYIEGSWQNINYFLDIKKDVLKAFNIKFNLKKEDEIYLKDIMNCTSICIHVRRGDFLSEEYKYTHDLCKLDYYKNAIQIIEKKIIKKGITEWRYFVFSDDISYCKEHLAFKKNIVFIDHELSNTNQLNIYNGKVDMLLMSKCQYAIISNSTFAFWSVFITDFKDKIVICPRFVVRYKFAWIEFSVPNHWVKVNNL